MWNYSKWSLSLYILLSTIQGIQCQSGITYLDDEMWGGRLGDKLIMFVKAKWVAHRTNLPFYYKPFKYSDQLVLHETELRFSSKIKQTLQPTHPYEIISSLNEHINTHANKLYTIHYYFTLPHWSNTQQLYDSQEIMSWKEVIEDKIFIQKLKESIKPRNNLAIHLPPTNNITVAMHVRKGGGFDLPLLSPQIYDVSCLQNLTEVPRTPKGEYADKVWPLKFAPDQYYIDQIKRLSEMFNDSPMYVYIYTDHSSPKDLASLYAKLINKPNITFDYRKDKNLHTINVLEDLFSMAQYDCLIRGGSNLPQIAQLIGNHKIVIYPLSCKWNDQTLIIDKVGMYTRNP